MSVEVTCVTKISDKACLVQSVNEIMGAKVCKVLAKPKKVSGYQSKHKVDIEVVVPNLFGTAGFAKQKDTNYTFVYDSTDRYALEKLLPKYNADKIMVSDPLMHTYMKNKVAKGLQKRNIKMMSSKALPNGKFKMTVKV